jgi:hypothetical protein
MSIRNWIWCCILLSIFLLPVSLFGQEDTLLLVASNTNIRGYAVSVYDIFAFVAAVDSIKVANYSEPPALPTVTSFPVNWSLDIEIRDSLAYYVGDSLYIRDISNPSDPKPVGSCPLGEDWAFRVHLFDSLALVMHSTPIEYCLLRIIDISDPRDPQILSTPDATPYGSMWTYMDAWKKDNYVYWVDDVMGEYLGRIIVLDITDPTEPVPIVVDTCLPSPPSGIWIKDDYAYVTLTDYYADHGGLMVLDISDPYDIDSVGFFETPYTARNIHIKDNLAYVSSLGLYVIDIIDPTSPALVTYYDTPYGCMDAFVDEPYVLVAEQSSLLLFQASFLILGDVNWDRKVDIADVVYLVNYLFIDGPEPPNPSLADVSFDGQINIADAVYLANYLFFGGSLRG